MSRLPKALEMGGLRLRCAMIFAMTGLATLAGCAAGGDPDKPTAASCEKLRDHMVELRFGGKAPPDVPGIPKAQMARDMAKHRANLAASLDKRLVPKCQSAMSKAHVECALRATSGADVATCNSEFSNEGVGQ